MAKAKQEKKLSMVCTAMCGASETWELSFGLSLRGAREPSVSPVLLWQITNPAAVHHIHA